ncbi:MAG TPA: glycosyltransferase family 39 protein [Terriglobales bacterium]|nr:glycosyltransferase family 39 protein [Terriglobales bacterium]
MEKGRFQPSENWITGMVLLCLGIAILLTNPRFTFMDDEIAMIQDATVPMQQTIHSFLAGNGLHRHPPLYDLILAGWMRATAGRVSLLRVPATVFYVIGLWFAIQAARLLGGVGASRAALWIGVIFPYGFHFGRVAGWYSFSFFTVALLTYAYFRFDERPSWGRWAALVAASVLAIYTNYFLAVLIGLMVLDYWLRNWRDSKRVTAAGVTLLVVLLGFAPLLRALEFRVAADQRLLRPAYSLTTTGLFGGYNIYTLFVSESVAPWFWYFSVPALMAIALCACFVLRYGPAPARRLIIGFSACILLMTALNLINTKRLLFLSPWLLLPLALMVAALPRPNLRKTAIMALGLTGVIGWFGIFSRHYYAAPRLIEPWQPVAERVAVEVKKGAVVIGNNPSFFFYLTEALRSSESTGTDNFAGTYPVYLQHDGLFDTNQWIKAGKVFGATTLLVKGAADETFWGSTAATEGVLDQNCHLEVVERELPDSGYALKRRWFAGAQQPAWRIEVRTYECPGSNETAARLRN